jgi:hypothetical protein
MSPDGSSYIFDMESEPLPEPVGANGFKDVYETVRTSTGWRTVRLLTPTGVQSELPVPGGASPDHQFSFFSVNEVEDSGTLGGTNGGTYLRRPDGAFEHIGIGSLGVEPTATGQLVTSNGTHIIFSSKGAQCSVNCNAKQLEPDAPPTGTAAVYDRSANGPTHVISLLPGNVTPAAGEHAEYQGASADGSVVAFKIGGVLYARIDDTTTVTVAEGASTFAGISEHGGDIFYLRNGDVFDFIVASRQTEQVNASGDAELTHIPEDGSHVYFVSRSLLDGTKGTLGQPNMYVWDAASEATTFIATLVQGDVEGSPNLVNWTAVVSPVATEIGPAGPGTDASRTSANGSVIAFESAAKLTNYENAGQREIYIYQEGRAGPDCVSCNPAGTPAVSGARFEYRKPELGLTPQSLHAVINNVTDDGAQVFFETSEQLVPTDHDGINDIYEWSAGSSGRAPSLALISSGVSPLYQKVDPIFGGGAMANNVIAGITPNGGDVVFESTDALLPTAGAGGEYVVYDARVDGGFAEPSAPLCSDDACQPVSQPPVLEEAGSVGFGGRGNAHKQKQMCRKRGKASKGRKACPKHKGKSKHRSKRKQPSHKHGGQSGHGSRTGGSK